MKIRIITIHSIPNFGSVFQAYALCAYLKSRGFSDTELIDYRPPYFKTRSLRAFAGKMLNLKSFCRRKRKFEAFIEKNIPLTAKSFTSHEQLKNHSFGADAYIAGGDQLWNVYHACGKDDAYKLTFTEGKKISYATSMGQTDFSDEELTELAEKLKAFSAVSVREASSVAMLSEKGIAAMQCVDPVYLLSADEYEKFLKPVKQPKYMLVYLVTPSPLLEKTIKLLSEKYGLKVILCSGFSKKCTCDEFLKDLGPDEILSYIKNAEIVLSSSFHATSFSMIFKKQFFTILPDEHTNERIVDILRIRGLSDRIITEKTELEAALERKIDYSVLSDYSELAEQSEKYLERALSE